MRRTVLVLVLCSWWLVAPTPTHAFVPRAGNVVVVSEPLQDDVYISGGTVEAVAPVDGDLVVVGGTVTVAGPVTGSVLAAGGTLSFGGSVGRSIRAAGGTLSMTDHVGSDVVVAGGTIVIERTAEIGRDLVAAGGTVRVSGSVKRNALLNGGRIFISGTIQGDADVRANHIVLLPTARVQGRLRYTSEGMAEIDPAAQVTGGVERLTPPPAPRPMFRFDSVLARLVVAVLEALWLLALGFAAVAIAPRWTAGVAERIRRQVGLSLLVGFVLLVVVPVGVVILLATVVMIPASVVAMLLYLATLSPGTIFTAARVGEGIVGVVQRNAARSTSAYITMTLGVLVLVILFAIPWVGWALRLLAMLIGFGALWATIWEARNSGQPGASRA